MTPRTWTWREQLSLATLDHDLREASQSLGVAVIKL